MVGPLPRPARAGRGDGRGGKRVLGVGSRPVAPGARRDAIRRSASLCSRSPTWCAGSGICILSCAGSRPGSSPGRVFDQALVDAAIGRVQAHMDGLGHPTVLGRPMLTHALMDVMLLAGSPLLEDVGARADLFAALRSRELNNARRHGVEQLARTLVEMGVLSELPFRAQPSREEWLARSQAGEIDVPAVWLDWTRRWFETSTLGRSQSHAHLLRADQSRPLAVSRAPGPHRPGFVGQTTGRRVDRGRRPTVAWASCPRR